MVSDPSILTITYPLFGQDVTMAGTPGAGSGVV